MPLETFAVPNYRVTQKGIADYKATVQGIKNNFHLMQLAGTRDWGLIKTRHHARLCKYAANK